MTQYEKTATAYLEAGLASRISQQTLSHVSISNPELAAEIRQARGEVYGGKSELRTRPQARKALAS